MASSTQNDLTIQNDLTNKQQWFTEFFDSEGSAFSLKIQEHLESVTSPYQSIDIYKTAHFGNLMVIDGCTMLSSRDHFLYHEMMTHVPLFSHPDPKKVLIIGGGDCGALNEVLKHPKIEQVCQVDIDEQVTRLSERYFPELCRSNKDPRASLHFEDGIKFIKEAQPSSFDVIIIDSTDPVGPAEGLFAADFYQHCAKVLTDDGIIIQQSESPLYHSQSIIRKMHQDLKEADFVTSHTLPFPQPIYPSGWWSCTLAKKQGNALEFRKEDARNKSFETQYYNADIHQAALVLPEFMRKPLP